jgi:hypothetical protein
MPSQDFSPIPTAAHNFASTPVPSWPSSPDKSTPPSPVPNLPAVIEKSHWRRTALFVLGTILLAAMLLAWPVLERRAIVKVLPKMHVLFDTIGLHVAPEWEGLIFNNVKSELKYDSGMMKLYVDGTVHNSTSEAQLIPSIKARAMGPDKGVIQSWMIEAPAATIESGGDVPFHTEVATSMEHTIEDVYLEFTSQDEKGDAANK